MISHIPVLKSETIELLNIRPDRLYADLTTGLGGHSAAIAELLTAGGRLICRDRDPLALEMARANLAPWADRVAFEVGLFSDFSPLEKVDGLLADLGMSMYQARSAERGFSFRDEGPLDMRMSPGDEITASHIVNFYSEEEIARILFDFGEERSARKIARAILRARPVSSTQSLATIIEQAKPRIGKLHPATLSFQALRIAVNRELEEVEKLMETIPHAVARGGRAVVISFHSLEDRIVKQAFQGLARSGRAKLINKHVVQAGAEEKRRNPASRSAKLRALEMA